MKITIKGIKAVADIKVEVGLEELELELEKEDYEGLKDLQKTQQQGHEIRERNRNVREFIDCNMTNEIRDVISHEIAKQIRDSFESK